MVYSPGLLEPRTLTIKTLKEFGLTGAKLATEAGRESTLLTVVFRHLGLTVPHRVRVRCIAKLWDEVEQEAALAGLRQRTRGTCSSDRMARTIDAAAFDEGFGKRLKGQATRPLLPVRGTLPRKARVAGEGDVSAGHHHRLSLNWLCSCIFRVTCLRSISLQDTLKTCRHIDVHVVAKSCQQICIIAPSVRTAATPIKTF